MRTTASRDVSWRASVRPAAWRDGVLLAYLLYVICAGVAQMLGLAPNLQEDPSAAASTPANQVVILALFAVSIATALAMGLALRHVLMGTGAFAAVIALVVLSPLWSIAPDFALRRMLRFMLEFSALIVLASCFCEPTRLLTVVWRMVAIVVALDIAVLAVPHLSFTEIGYQGVHGHKNTAGSFALLALPVAVVAVWRRDIVPSRVAAWATLAGVLLVVALSQSKTSAALSLVALGFAAGALLLCRARGETLLVIGLVGAGLALIAAYLVSASGLRVETALTSLGIDPTLTGRDDVWRYTLTRAADRPWLGFGYGSFWNAGPSDEQALLDFGITFLFGQAHNGYIDVVVQLGRIGVVAVVVMGLAILAGLARRARLAQDRALVWVGLTVYATFWLHNITESTLLRTGTDMWIFLVLFSAVLIKTTRPA